MKIKDLIKHLETLDQEKELVILAKDPTDWEYGKVVDAESIQLESVMPHEENGLEGELEMPKAIDDEEIVDVDCYVIRMDV